MNFHAGPRAAVFLFQLPKEGYVPFLIFDYIWPFFDKIGRVGSSTLRIRIRRYLWHDWMLEIWV
jgi:hypothetical protein